MVPISFSRTMAMRRQHQRHHHDDVGHHAGHEVVAAVQVGIEPHARARRHLRQRDVRAPRRDCASAMRTFCCPAITSFENSAITSPRVARHQRRRVGVRAVHQHLHLRWAAPRCKIALEIRQHAHHRLHLAAVQQPAAPPLRCAACATTSKRPEPSKRSRRSRLIGRAVHIHPGDARVVHVQVHGEAENHQLHHRRQEQQHRACAARATPGSTPSAESREFVPT